MFKSDSLPLRLIAKLVEKRAASHVDSAAKSDCPRRLADRKKSGPFCEQLEARVLFDAVPFADTVPFAQFDKVEDLSMPQLPISATNSAVVPAGNVGLQDSSASIVFWKEEVSQQQVGDVWQYSYNVFVQNNGNTDLTHINLFEDLDDTWGDGFERRVSVVYNACDIPDSQRPTLNLAMWSTGDSPYNGTDSTNLLNGDGYLKPGEEFSIQVTVELTKEFVGDMPLDGETLVVAHDAETGAIVSYGTQTDAPFEDPPNSDDLEPGDGVSDDKKDIADGSIPQPDDQQVLDPFGDGQLQEEDPPTIDEPLVNDGKNDDETDSDEGGDVVVAEPSINFWKEEVGQEQVGDSWNYTYDIFIQNDGNTDLANINLFEDLDDTWGDKFVRRVTIVYNACVIPEHRQPTLNIAMWSTGDSPYNGIDSTNLFNGDGYLKPGEEFSIRVTVELNCEYTGGSPPDGDTRVEGEDVDTGVIVSDGPEVVIDDGTGGGEEGGGEEGGGEEGGGEEGGGEEGGGEEGGGEEGGGEEGGGEEGGGEEGGGEEGGGEEGGGEEGGGEEGGGEEGGGEEGGGEEGGGEEGGGEEGGGEEGGGEEGGGEEGGGEEGGGEEGGGEEGGGEEETEPPIETEKNEKLEEKTDPESTEPPTVLLVDFAFDSITNLSKTPPIANSNATNISQSRNIYALASDPIFSGLARPGTKIFCNLFDRFGNPCGSNSCSADAGGNWLVQVHCGEANEFYRVEFTSEPIVFDVFGYIGFDAANSTYEELRADPSSVDRSEYLSGSNNFAQSDSHRIVDAFHQLNNRPLGFDRKAS